MKYLIIGLCLTLTFCTCTFGNVITREYSTKYVCADRSFTINDLENRLDFTRKAFSVTSNNKIIELYINKYKGNWLIMVTGTDKITCGLIGGQQNLYLNRRIIWHQHLQVV